MKTKQILILLSFFFFAFNQPAHSQFLKKLVKHAKEKVKQETERRAQRRVDKGIDKTFDKTEEKIDNSVSKKKTKKDKNNDETKQQADVKHAISTMLSAKPSNTKPAAQYSFDYKLTYKVETGKRNMNIHYYLKNKVRYYGAVVEGDGVKNQMDYFSVFDYKRKIMINYSKQNAQKQKTVIDMSTFWDALGMDQEDDKQLPVKKIGKKKILGYTCQGYQSVTDEGTFTVYIATHPPVTTPIEAFTTNKKFDGRMTPEIMQNLKKGGLVLELRYKSKHKNDPDNIVMTAVALKRNKLTINSNEYQSLGF